MSRGYNFGAGPAMLPKSVLQEAQRDLLDWQHTGMSILEIGHRTPEFRGLLDEAESRLRALLTIPSNYQVLFLSGPARHLFAMIPMNFLGPDDSADYLVTGLWSDLAYQEAQKLKAARAVTVPVRGSGSHEQVAGRREMDADQGNLPNYFYYTPNETVQGIYTPKPTIPREIALIADMTSCLLAEPICVADYDLIFAGAQKNIANAGLTLVIISQRLLDRIPNTTLPTILDFRTHVTHRSLYATPATFNCYLANLMFAWVAEQGGVEALYAINQQKAKKLYEFIDNSSFYICPVEHSKRSLFNVCFNVPTAADEASFLEKAISKKLYALKGHRVVGGLRASLYNAMPMAGVDSLIKFMQDFSSGCFK